MSVRAREHLLRAHRNALKKAGDLGVYRGSSGDGPPEYFVVREATEEVGNTIQTIVGEYHVSLLDREWWRGDQVVLDGLDSYEITGFLSRDSGLLTLLAGVV